MESPNSRVAKLLREKQNIRRKAAIFFGLALLVILGTAAVLLLHAQAMNHTRRMLECAYTTHQHTEECYPDGDISAQPICGLADAVVHVHNEDCYDGEGALVCPLEELEPHTHDENCLVERRELICGLDGIDEADLPADSSEATPASAAGTVHTHTEDCYAPGERVLVCGQEEQEGHAHSDACYTEQPPVLSCGQEEGEAHTHTEDCYTGGGLALSCGQEERAGHVHSDACYADGEPVMVCGQEESAPVGDSANEPASAGEGEPPHIHTEDCYRVYTELGCGKLELHTHTDECYTTVEPENPEEPPYQVLTCTIPQLEEHIHSEECFATVELTPEEVAALEQQGTVIRDLQLVYEDADIRVTADYDTTALIPEGAALALVGADTPMPEPTPVLTVGLEPGAGTLDTSGPDTSAPESNTENDVDALTDPPVPDVVNDNPEDGTAGDTPENPESVPENNDAPEAGSENNADSQNPESSSGADTNLENPENPENDAEGAPSETGADVSACGGNINSDLVRAGFMAEGREWLPASTATYTVQYLENGVPLGEPVEYYYTPGGQLPVFPRAVARYTRECRADAFIVTATYTALAEIPEEAELRAALVTDEAVVAEHETEYRAALHSEQAQMVSLMDIGFWLDGEEVQPAAPVRITVQFLGEDGLPVGEPLTVVHFAEAGMEIMRADVDESGAATFDMNGFSLVGLGYTPEAGEDGHVTLDHTFEWTDENGLFRMTFHVKGVAGPKSADDVSGADHDSVEPDVQLDADASDGNSADTSTGDADAADASAPAGAPENGDTGVESTGAAPEDGASASEASEEEDAEDGGADEQDARPVDAPLANASYLAFSVETLGEDDAAYAAYAEYSAGNADAKELLNLAVLRYALTYGGEELDLSDCEIEVTLVPTERMELAAAAYQRENPADNGDDDGDGYVLAADGETLLPAPMLDTSVRLSAVAPVADASAADTSVSGEPVPGEPTAEGSGAPEGGGMLAEQGAVTLGGQEYAARLDEAGADLSDASLLGGVDEPEAEEDTPDTALDAGAPVSGAPAESGAEPAGQAVTFTITPDAARAAGADTANTLGAELSLSINPRYTVQYYARLPKADLDLTTAPANVDLLPVIDTSGGHLPVNGKGKDASPSANDKFKNIPVNKDGSVVTTMEPVKTYREKQFNYLNAPELIYTDMLISNEHYVPEELWVLRPGVEDKDSLDEKDWIVYKQFKIEAANWDDGYAQEEITTPDGIMYILYRYLAIDPNKNEVKLSFTNRPNGSDYTPYKVGEITYIPLNDQSVIRWVYKAKTQAVPIDAMFHDYDISSSVSNNTMITSEGGINDPKNRDSANTGTPYAFGNANAGTKYGVDGNKYKWKSNYINRRNRYTALDAPNPAGIDRSYTGATFEMVTDINSDGSKVQFDSGISAPMELFGDGTAIGKTSFNGDVTFNRNGDTYTLQAARVLNNDTAKTEQKTLTGLDRFSHPGKYAIWTNHFWMMDGYKGAQDPQFGATDTNLNLKSPIIYHTKPNDINYAMPKSDNGQNHNSYFGMQFQVDFELTDKYVGPLDYLFYGDDDLWVFLSKVDDDGKIVPWDGPEGTQYGKLVCDLGGIHSSVGEYTNLWDYIPGGQDGTRETQKYRLSFFYTERGASGSTCWMQFTLPNVTSPKMGEASPKENYGSLEIQKEVFRMTVDGKDANQRTPFDNGDVFGFQIKLTRGEDKEEPPLNLNYTLYTRREGGEDVSANHMTFNGGVVWLKHNQRIVIENLPVGTTYEVTEIGARTPDLQSTEPVASNYTYDTQVFAGQVDGMTGTGGKSTDLRQVVNVTQNWAEKKHSKMISANKTEVVKFENVYRVYNLPKTGGVTMEWYVLGGGALVLAMALALHRRRRKSHSAP